MKCPNGCDLSNKWVEFDIYCPICGATLEKKKKKERAIIQFDGLRKVK